MTKAKSLLLAVAAAAMAFTVSCSSDGGSENIGTCGGREYDTRLGYSCVNGELVGSCRGKDYYPEYEHCENGEVKEGTEISSSSGGGGSSPSGGGNTFADSRDGKTYKKVTIGTQTWMAENLNYIASGSKCYGEDGQVIIGYDENDNSITKTLLPSEVQANCATYGRLYNWETALTVCPSGWRLPSNDDWDELLLYVDAQNGGDGEYSEYGTPYFSNTAGKHLKAASGWVWDDENNVSGGGTDKYGFSALPGGSGGNTDSDFGQIGSRGRWWSANDCGWELGGCYSRRMRWNRQYVSADEGGHKSDLFSVRCLQGNPSSSSGGGGSSSSGGNTQEKTLAVAMPSDIFSNTADFWVYIVPVGTTLETMYQSAEDIIIAVGGNMLNLDWSYSGTTASFPLYKFKFDGGGITDGRWTGSGTYNVFVVFENDIGSYIYLKESVNFSSATTNIQINSGNLVESRDYNVPSSSSGGGNGNSQSYGYCLFSEHEICLNGPFTSKDCGDLGGLPSNNCPYVPSSSSVVEPSSSSSSPSALPSSSSRSSLPLDSISGQCKSGGKQLFCQYANNGCYELNTDYSEGDGCMRPDCTCSQVVAGCVNEGSVYTGVTGIDESPWGQGVNCATNGGTWTGYGKEPQ